jgi:DNA-binding beta-propeller fold protein YncE
VQHHPLVRRTLAATTLLGVVVAASLAAAPASAAPADSRSFAVASTPDAGDLVRSLAVDDSADRTYFTIDRGSGFPGAIGWLTTSTGAVSEQNIELAGEEPSVIAVNETAHELYVLHYRSGELTVIDTTSSTVEKVIGGVPAYPVALEVDPDSHDVYVLGDGVTTVDVSTGEVSAEIPISSEAFPLLKDGLYDSRTKLLWIAEGRAGVVTAFNTLTQTWLSDVAIPVTAFPYDGTALGGRPSALALDEQLGTLYVAVAPRLQDSWTNTKLISIDTATALHIGTPIELGNTIRELAVDASTHEVYAVNGFSNTLSVVDPVSWTATTAVDFSALGITTGTGAANANVWALAVSEATDRVLVSHPYGTSRISVIDRSGTVGTPTVREATPGQNQPAPEAPENAVWQGPARAELSDAPATAVATSGNSFAWSFSNYSKGWATTLFGHVTSDDDHVMTFTDGVGWADPASGRAQIAWSDGFSFQPYPGLAPDVRMTFGNPLLTLAADGSGTVTFDVSWSVASDVVSDGFSRVEVATLPAGSVSVSGETVSFERSPDYAGRQYTDSNGIVHPSSFPAEYLDYLNEAIRAWFYSSGSSLDPTKVPNAVAVSYRVPAAAEVPAPGDGGVTPPVVGEPSGGAGSGTGGAGSGTGGTAPAGPVASGAAPTGEALAATGLDLELPLAAGLLFLATGIAIALRRRATAG